MLQINKEKMSKSLGNFMLLRDVLDTTRPEVLRFLMLQTHYRSPLDFSEERLAEAAAALGRIENAVKNLDWQLASTSDASSSVDVERLSEQARHTRDVFIEAMDDDFNAPRALGAVFDLVNDANAELADKTISQADAPAVREVRETIVTLMGVFGIDIEAQVTGEGAQAYPVEVVALAADLAGFEGEDPFDAVEALLDARAAARAAKEWAVADAVRDGLVGLGFVIEDTPQGARVTFEG